jgi:ribose/xylose/arabinose/galactoside ABC-type transport system permease subunit
MDQALTVNRAVKKNLFVRFFRIREIGALIPLILVIIVTSIINKSFYSANNVVNMMRATSYIFIAGVGMTYVLCSNGLDLSIGSQMALSSILLGILLVNYRLPIWISIIITLICGAAAGAFNGFLVTGLGFPPFIATLATYYSYRGIVLGVTRGAPISPMPEAFKVIGLGRLLGIPYVIYFMVILFIIATFVLRKTKYGRYILARGGNEESTRLAGINTRLLTFSTYVLMGILAFTSGIFFTSRFSSAQPTTGTGLELRVIAACIIGGVSLFGGSGSIAGTFVGSTFMVVLENAMSMARISGYWKMTVLGVIIIIAIIIDLARKKELFKKE